MQKLLTVEYLRNLEIDEKFKERGSLYKAYFFTLNPEDACLYFHQLPYDARSTFCLNIAAEKVSFDLRKTGYEDFHQHLVAELINNLPESSSWLSRWPLCERSANLTFKSPSFA